MAEQTAARPRRAPAENLPGISDDVLRAVDVLEDQLERILGPRLVPPPPVIRNVNELAAEQMTPGARVADAFAAVIGSWRFIITQSIILAIWIVLNVVGWVQHWDPYPFILLNLALSFQAAFAGPIIMMSQNRQGAKDRITAEEDFRVNRLAEDEIRAIMDHLARQDEVMLHILERLERYHYPPRLSGNSGHGHPAPEADAGVLPPHGEGTGGVEPE